MAGSSATTSIASMRAPNSDAGQKPGVGLRDVAKGFGLRLGASLGGNAHQALDLASGHVSVIKVVDPCGWGGAGSTDLAKIDAELARWRELKHPHVARVLQHAFASSQLYVQVPFLPNGSVVDMISEFGPLCSRQLHRAARGALEGLGYLHSRRPPIAHGNLRGANLLVDSDLNVKIVDYGYADMVDHVLEWSIPWTAPEVIQRTSCDKRTADIWSFGCTVIEMSTGEAPWGTGVPREQLVSALERQDGPSVALAPAIPAVLPGSGKEMLRACLQREPSQRPRASELLWHAFMLP